MQAARAVRNRPIAQMVLGGAIATVILLAVVLSIDWFPADASTQASNIRTFYDVMLIVSVPIFEGL